MVASAQCQFLLTRTYLDDHINVLVDLCELSLRFAICFDSFFRKTVKSTPQLLLVKVWKEQSHFTVFPQFCVHVYTELGKKLFPQTVLGHSIPKN